MKRFNFIRDSVSASIRDIDLAKYEVDQIKKERMEANLKAVENENKYKLFFRSTISILVFLLVSIIGLFLLIISRKKLRIAKQEVSQKLKENQLLFQEVNHRVGNNLELILSIVRFQAEEISNPALKEKFINLESRISTIAIAHQQFMVTDRAFTGNMHNLKAYIYKISKSLQQVAVRPISYHQNIPDIDMPIDTVLPIGIILNELITNSIKHAETVGTLVIELAVHQKNKIVTLNYKDSGTNFKATENDDSLGLFIITSMVEQLKGSIQRIESSYIIKLRQKN
jgi:two-component sensor histidine kinase